jgi:hypothetical protein
MGSRIFLLLEEVILFTFTSGILLLAYFSGRKKSHLVAALYLSSLCLAIEVINIVPILPESILSQIVYVAAIAGLGGVIVFLGSVNYSTLPSPDSSERSVPTHGRGDKLLRGIYAVAAVLAYAVFALGVSGLNVAKPTGSEVTAAASVALALYYLVLTINMLLAYVQLALLIRLRVTENPRV